MPADPDLESEDGCPGTRLKDSLRHGYEGQAVPLQALLEPPCQPGPSIASVQCPSLRAARGEVLEVRRSLASWLTQYEKGTDVLSFELVRFQVNDGCI